MRLVSLVPSSSYTVAFCPAIRPYLIACTKFCVEPADLHRFAELVGGTKDPDLERIKVLKPTHILVNREENKPDHIENLQSIAAVHDSLPKSPHDVIEMFLEMGEFLGQKAFFQDLASRLQDTLDLLSDGHFWEYQGLRPGLSYLYLIWRDPYMIVGQDTYISRLLELFDWKNAYTGFERYPTVTIQDMAAMQPDLLLLSSEPYPFRERDWQRLIKEWGQLEETYRRPVGWKVDGRLCSWHGLKTLEALDSFKKIRQAEKAEDLFKPLFLVP